MEGEKKMNNPMEDFQYIMELVLSYKKSTDDYNDGLSRLRGMLEWVREEIKKIGLDPQKLEVQAIELKDKNKGDILPCLQYLSQFTPVYEDTKADYLKGVLWWIFTGQEYLERNIKIAKRLKESKR
jgi:hypothetical protein